MKNDEEIYEVSFRIFLLKVGFFNAFHHESLHSSHSRLVSLVFAVVGSANLWELPFKLMYAFIASKDLS